MQDENDQRELDAEIKRLNETRSREEKTGTTNAWTPKLVSQLSIGIGSFAILSFIFVTFLIWKRRATPEQILRTFGILIIVFCAVFLVIAGYSQTQITPVIGLLGTIAGYLLGRRPEATPDSENGKKRNSHVKNSKKNKEAVS